jgi:arylsulfatase A-like enzyme
MFAGRRGIRLLLPVVAGSVLAAGLAAPLPGAAPAPAAMGAAPEAERPNVLIIMTDDQRAGTLGVMPQTRRLFRRGGTTFPNAYATTPLCCPSRASVYTGRYAHNHEVRTNDDPELLEPESTVQRYLQDAGYRTAAFGKYFNIWRHDPPHFDHWELFYGRARYRRPTMNVNGTVRDFRRYSTDLLAARAARLIRRWGEGNDPWFLYVAPFAPHAPYEPKRQHERVRIARWKGNPAVFEADRSDKPPWVRTKAAPFKRAQRVRAAQLRTLMSVDELVGQLFRALRQTGQQRDTMAFYLSDHGLLWGEHGLLQKHSPYAPSVKIPFLVRWPGRIPGGRVDRRLVATVDVVPTVLEAAGVDPDPDFPIDGRSLLGDHARDRLLLEHFRRLTKNVPTWASTITPTYQYVEYHDHETGGISFREYYDLVNDRWQLTNLLGDGDPSNDPPLGHLLDAHTTLSRDRRCQGTTGSAPCP